MDGAVPMSGRATYFDLPRDLDSSSSSLARTSYAFANLS
jgi:hypothetical protein